MLALKRKKGESLTITMPDGRVMVVEIVDVRGDVVKVGIEAPQDVQILRTELSERGGREAVTCRRRCP